MTAEHDGDGYKYELFRKTYFDAPDRFALECINWEDDEYPADYQLEILSEIPRQKRVCVRGPHGLGKTMLAAIAIHWFALTRDGLDWKIVTTASVWRQLIDYLWPEVHKWSRRIKWDVVGRERYNDNSELFTLKMRLTTGQALAAASDDSNQIEGAHAKNILYIFDESKIIPDPTWVSAEGAMSTGKGRAYWLAISTPGDAVGTFYDIQMRKEGYEDWWTRHVTLEEAVVAGRIDPDWADQRAAQWGRTSALFINRVLGDFASAPEESVIPASWVDAAIERGKQFDLTFRVAELISHVGIDIARGGADKTVYAPRVGDMCLEMTETGSQDTMVTAGEVVQMIEKYPNAVFVIDVIGLGAGVYDRVREVFMERYPGKEMPLYPFIASASTEWLDKSEQLRFADTRSAAWWNMRELLDPAYGMNVVLPDNRDLRKELATPTFKSMSDGRIKVEPKEEIRKRLGRSTNFADALIMGYWEEVFLVGMEFG